VSQVVKDRFDYFLHCATALRIHTGQSMTEYGLVLALVALAAIVAWTALGGNLNSVISTISGSI
jgi:Flp pilus assembly pilin Flp